MPEKKQIPIATVSVGHVHGAVWRNENQGGVYYTATFENRYSTPDGWKTTANYTQPELLALMKCADLAWNAIAELQRHDKEGSPSK